MRAREFMMQKSTYDGMDVGRTNRKRKDATTAPKQMQPTRQSVARSPDRGCARQKGRASDLPGRR
jgi:hypothetical protein